MVTRIDYDVRRSASNPVVRRAPAGFTVGAQLSDTVVHVLARHGPAPLPGLSTGKLRRQGRFGAKVTILKKGLAKHRPARQNARPIELRLHLTGRPEAW